MRKVVLFFSFQTHKGPLLLLYDVIPSTLGDIFFWVGHTSFCCYINVSLRLRIDIGREVRGDGGKASQG